MSGIAPRQDSEGAPLAGSGPESTPSPSSTNTRTSSEKTSTSVEKLSTILTQGGQSIPGGAGYYPLSGLSTITVYGAAGVGPVSTFVATFQPSAATTSDSTSATSSTPSTALSAEASKTTSTQKPTTSATQQDSGKGDSGFSPGVVAGTAIGSAIGAALIAMLTMFFLCRPKRHSKTAGAVYAREKPSSSRGHPWDAYLPQSADDDTVRNAVQSLCTQIDMHVENFYRNSAITMPISVESQAAIAKLNASFLPLSPEILLLSAAPRPVLKHLYAWVILSKLSPADNGEDSLLPAELARSPQAAATKHRNPKEAEAMLQAYDYWRVLTAHLLYPQSEKNTTSKREPRLNAQPLCDALMRLFEPWLKSIDDTAAAGNHLRSVLKTASETGLLIMAQRSSFEFRWDVTRPRTGPSSGHESVVVMPAFAKTADENGDMLSHFQVLIKPKVERM